MVILDANAVLRYILNDNEDMATEVEAIIIKHEALVTIEIIAEVIYVLQSVYKVEKKDIVQSIINFMSEVSAEENNVIIFAIKAYGKENIDFVDCILYAYKCIKKYKIFTFDKKLKKLLLTADNG